MKRVALEQLPQEIAELIVSAQHERVLITRQGQPYALVVGVENKDEEDLQLEFSPAFWRLIEERRRQEASVSLEEVMAELAAEEQRLNDQGEATPAKTPAAGA
ncbi:MAG: hypothetical protein L0Z62_41170 [Gemmataceae bacterium]|nr:hypothetical protein [Gemmataceae bacterium]